MPVRCPKCHSENSETARYCSNCATSLSKVGAKDPASFTKPLEPPVPIIAPGTIVARHYEILKELGRGGMGEVYRAIDKNLGRQVAIKVLPQEFAQDPERMARFGREARLLAALNHPHIAAIHGIEEEEGRRYLILELVEGETLQTHLDQGPLPVEEALETCRRVAEGLEAAHEKGIIHRDLKPGNIMIPPEGGVKILDFGLAKAFQDETTSPEIEKSPTITARMTEPGVILGTAAYMSPEQARGRAVDKRTDIWAFGCIFFECFTGKRPFHGETVSDTLAEILKAEPDWASLPAATPRAIRTLIRRCLEKDPKKRLHDIADARIEIEETSSGAAQEVAAPKRFPLGAVLAIAAAALIAGILIRPLLWRTYAPAPLSPISSLIKLEPGHSLDGMRRAVEFNWPSRTAMAISRDGKFIVYCAAHDEAKTESRPQLFMRSLDKLEASPIAGTGGGIAPFLSPDDRWVGFWAESRLKKVSIEGGVPQDLCECSFPFGASWGDDGMILFARDENTGLFAVPDQGGNPEMLTTPDPRQGEYSHRLPNLLPRGKGVLFTIMGSGADLQPRVAILEVAAKKWQVLFENGSDARYVPSGHIIFLRQGTLMAVAFDPDHPDLMGQPVPVVPNVLQMLNSTHTNFNTAAGQFSASPAEELVYSPGGIVPDKRNALVWVDKEGHERPLSSELKAYFAPRLSPDGRKVVYKTSGTEAALWIFDLERGLSSQFFAESKSYWPVWTRDGKSVLFGWTGETPAVNIYVQPADGSRASERIIAGQFAQSPSSLSPDGNLLAFTEYKNNQEDILIYDFQEKAIVPFAATENDEIWPEFSPDGRRLAYVSDQEGRFEVYVRRSSGVGPIVKVSHGGGREPIWARSGKQLFYRSLDGSQMWVVDVLSARVFSVTQPRKLFEKRGFSSGIPIRSYDISLDDQFFLMVRNEERQPRSVTEMILVQNWFGELKRLAPSSKK